MPSPPITTSAESLMHVWSQPGTTFYPKLARLGLLHAIKDSGLAANEGIYGTGSEGVDTYTLTSYIRGLGAAVDSAAARAYLEIEEDAGGTVTSVNITQPAAGITASGGPITTSGAITLALANDLAALEGLSGTGVAYRSGSDTWSLLNLDTDGTLAANSDTRIPSQKAVKTYVDTAVTGLLDFKGATDASSNPNYPAASKGDAYVVSVAGKVGGGSGKSVDVGDVYLATADNAGGTEASVGTSWTVLEHNLVGALLAANNLSDVVNGATAVNNIFGASSTGTGGAVRRTDPTLVGTVTMTQSSNGTTHFVITPHTATDSGSDTFRINSQSYPNSPPGTGYNYVVEMGHGNDAGGGISSTYGGFRDAWEQHYWNGSAYYAERHIAVARPGEGELRPITIAYDQDNDGVLMNLTADTLTVIDKDGSTVWAKQFLNGVGDYRLQLNHDVIQPDASTKMLWGGTTQDSQIALHSSGSTFANGLLNITRVSPAANAETLNIAAGTVTGSLFPLNIVGSTSDRLAATIQQNGAGMAEMFLFMVGSGDPRLRLAVNGGGDWFVAVDNSDSDKLKLCKDGAGTGSDFLVIDTSGNVTVGPLAASTISMGTGVTTQKFLLFTSVNYRYGMGIATDEFRTYCPSTGHLSWGTIDIADGSTWAERMRLNNDGTFRLLAYTTNGFVKFSSSNGTLSVDTNTYLTANQTITLSGAVTGSGTTSITASQVREIGFFQSTAADGTIALSAKMSFSGTINQIRGLATASGSCTVAIKINGTNVTSLSGLSVTSTPQDVSATGANTFSAGDRITLVISSSSSPVGLEFSLKFTV